MADPLFFISENAPGWEPGKVYLGHLVDGNIYFPDSHSIMEYSQRLKNLVNNGFNIFGENLTQPMLAARYTAQLEEEIQMNEAAHTLTHIRDEDIRNVDGKLMKMAGGRRRTRTRRFRRSKRYKDNR